VGKVRQGPVDLALLGIAVAENETLDRILSTATARVEPASPEVVALHLAVGRRRKHRSCRETGRQL
jgi:hypothetical protein